MMSVPEELASAIERAAATVPGHGGDLHELRRRHQRRRRHRAAWSTGVVAALTGLAVAAVPFVVRADEPGATEPLGGAAASTPTPPPDAQRLLLSGVGWTRKPATGPAVGIMSVSGLGEVRADGSVATHRVPGVDGWYQAVGLRDGRIVVLGYRDAMRGVPRTDGPGVAGLSFVVEVLHTDGTVERRRTVGRDGERLTLVAATADTAYLMRSGGLVAHDLGTGAERPVSSAAALGGTAATARPTDVGASQIVVVDANEVSKCALRVVALRSGARLAEVPLATCASPDSVRLSPDGALAAVVYHGSPGLSGAPRVAVVDLTSGAVRVDRPLGADPDRPATVHGVAWSDSRTVRVAWAQLPAGADRVYRVDEVLRVETLTAP